MVRLHSCVPGELSLKLLLLGFRAALLDPTARRRLLRLHRVRLACMALRKDSPLRRAQVSSHEPRGFGCTRAQPCSVPSLQRNARLARSAAAPATRHRRVTAAARPASTVSRALSLLRDSCFRFVAHASSDWIVRASVTRLPGPAGSTSATQNSVRSEHDQLASPADRVCLTLCSVLRSRRRLVVRALLGRASASRATSGQAPASSALVRPLYRCSLRAPPLAEPFAFLLHFSACSSGFYKPNVGLAASCTVGLRR